MGFFVNSVPQSRFTKTFEFSIIYILDFESRDSYEKETLES